jgi:translation initiation factor IF-1
LLPNALYRVELDTRHRILAHTVSGLRRNFVRLVVGDRVLVELAPHDQGRGRIVRRLG